MRAVRGARGRARACGVVYEGEVSVPCEGRRALKLKKCFELCDGQGAHYDHYALRQLEGAQIGFVFSWGAQPVTQSRMKLMPALGLTTHLGS